MTTAADTRHRSPAEARALCERTRLLLVEAALSAPGIDELLEKAIGILYASFPLEGAAIWLARPDDPDARLKFRTAELPILKNCERLATSRLSNPEAAAALKAMLSSALGIIPQRHAGAARGVDRLSVASFTLTGGIRAFIAAWFPVSLSDLVIRGRWLHDILAPAVDLSRTIVRAHESFSLTTTLMRNSPDAIVGVDLTGRCQLWNPAAEALFGWVGQDVLRRPLKIVGQADGARWRDCLDAAAASGRPSRQVLTGQRWD